MDNYNSLQEEKEPDDLLKENIIRRNKKKIAQGTELPGKSMLKKGDLSLVFVGAGIITLIIFFVFLRSGDTDKDITQQSTPPVEETIKTLEQKLTTLEEMLQSINAGRGGVDGQPKVDMPDIKPYVARIERVETALSVKFDVLTARVDKMDDKLSSIIRDVEKNSRIVNNMKSTPSVQPKQAEVVIAAKTPPQVKDKDTAESKSKDQSETKAETKSSAKVTIKTPPDEPKKGNATTNKTASNSKPEPAPSAKQKQQKPNSNKGDALFHTVAKGDTLYNISKRYDTTVDQLRAMNKMTINDAIVIGQKLVVKK